MRANANPVADNNLKSSPVIALYIGSANAAIAGSGPRPPCGDGPPFPSYAAPGHAPNYHVWSNAGWEPPACTGWSPKDGVMVAVASQFRYPGSTEGLLLRFGAISTLTGLRYWSVTENDWRTLIIHAAALDRADLTRPRADFSVSEMAAKADVYFSETDNRLGEPIIYRMRAVRSEYRLIINTENVTSVQKLMLTLVDPGDLESGTLPSAICARHLELLWSRPDHRAAASCLGCCKRGVVCEPGARSLLALHGNNRRSTAGL